MASGTKTAEAVREVVLPVLAPLEVGLYDIEILSAGSNGPGRTVRILVDREGGIDLEGVAQATVAISSVLDETEIVAGPYGLEVSSPGIERPLRRPEHFRMALGSTISVKHHTPEGPRRLRGLLVESDDDACTVDVDGETRRIEYNDVTAARIVFEWGPTRRPGRGEPSGATGGKRPKEKARS